MGLALLTAALLEVGDGTGGARTAVAAGLRRLVGTAEAGQVDHDLRQLGRPRRGAGALGLDGGGLLAASHF